MANTMTKKDKVRLTLDLSEAIYKQLEDIGEETGKTKSELMRLAIDFLLRAQDARHEEMTVGAWKEDKANRVRIEREFVGLS